LLWSRRWWDEERGLTGLWKPERAGGDVRGSGVAQRRYDGDVWAGERSAGRGTWHPSQTFEHYPEEVIGRVGARVKKGLYSKEREDVCGRNRGKVKSEGQGAIAGSSARRGNCPMRDLTPEEAPGRGVGMDIPQLPTEENASGEGVS